LLRKNTKIERGISVLVNRRPNKVEDNSDLEEISNLVSSVGCEIVESLIFNIPNKRPFLGKGQLEKIQNLANSIKADFVVFSESLNLRNILSIEKYVSCKVIDRTKLILDLFSQNARTAESKIQVERAQLSYTLPRLTRMWTHLSRQSGGIGVRGPGETQLESDKRQIWKRISFLDGKLKNIEKLSSERRKSRKDLVKIALVGYTNAGKSTFMNLATSANVLSEDRLFSTLDSTTKVFKILNQKILLSDTVGFIKNLPPGLVASFRSTLAELNEADLIWHVVDSSRCDIEEQVHVTNEILGDLGVLEKERWYLFNKIDLIEERRRNEFIKKENYYAISSMKKKGLKKLFSDLEKWVISRSAKIKIFIPFNRQDLISQIYSQGHVLKEQVKQDGVFYTIIIPKNLLNYFKENDLALEKK
tara:strand:+ start:1680 stop:2933 length:1254 start_codon:yes stop_codon:yes gene_type:complete